MPNTSPKPNWQPIGKLPAIAKQIDDALQFTEKQRNLTEKAHVQLYSLDDATVNRIIKVFTDQQNVLKLFDEQLHRWKEDKSLTPKQRESVEELSEKMEQLNYLTTVIIALSEEIKEFYTIEKLLNKKDFQVILETLSGKNLTKSEKPSN
jgi:hypothetical protein